MIINTSITLLPFVVFAFASCGLMMRYMPPLMAASALCFITLSCVFLFLARHQYTVYGVAEKYKVSLKEHLVRSGYEPKGIQFVKLKAPYPILHRVDPALLSPDLEK